MVYSSLSMPLGKKLKKLRKEKGLSQQELATKCSIAISTIQKIENSPHANPTLDVLLALTSALSCKIDDLVEKMD